MARIVLLEFADNALAEEFVKDVAETNQVGGVNPAGMPAHIYPAQVAAVVAKPTKWCTCDVPQSTGRRRGKRETGWSRGTTLGWWLCAHCRKPSRAMVTHWVTNMLAGANDLLPKILGGDAISPKDRWARDGGVSNPDANTHPDNPTVKHADSRRARKLARRG